MSRVQVPQDVESERSLLATICAPGAEHSASMCLPLLCPEDFMHPAHQAILEALRVIIRRGDDCSPFLLRDQLDASGKLGIVGGYVGLIEILGAEEVRKPLVLVEILSKHRRRRELIRMGVSLAKQAQDTSEDPEDMVHQAQTELHRITRDGRRDDGESWSEILFAMSSFEPFRRPGQERGGWWGIPTLDQIASIPRGEYVTVGARPGTGKTALMTQIAVESARKGLKVMVITLELPKLTMRARIASYLAKIPVSELKRGNYESSHVAEVGREAEMLECGRLHAPTAGTPWPKIEAMIRFEVDRYGIDLVVLDQFDKVGRPAVAKGSNEAYAFGAISTGIMGLAKELNLGFVLLCQLRGDAEGREPTLADHADSDRPGKDAGIVLHLWNDKERNLKAKLQKTRDGAFTGKRLDLDFHGDRQQFLEVERETETTTMGKFGRSLG